MDTQGIIMIVLGIVSALTALMIPTIKGIISLNSNIAALNTTIQQFRDEYKKDHSFLADRVKEHGNQIDALGIKQENHEVRIINLESK